MKRKATFLDSNPRPRTSRAVTKTGPTKESYYVKAKASTMNAGNLGVARIWNLIAPSFKIKQLNYFPRIGDFRANNGQTDMDTLEVDELACIIASPGKQSYHEIPHMSCFEWMTLTAKALDNQSLMYSEAMPAPQHVTGAVTTPNRKMLMEHCSYSYELVNCQLTTTFVEITEVQPIRPIADQLICTSFTNPDTSQTIFTSQDSSPLSCIYKDFVARKSFTNTRNPVDSSHNYTKDQAQQTPGYNISDAGSNFYKNYKVLSKKVFKLGPGSKVTYQMAIPAFKANSSLAQDSFTFTSRTTTGGNNFDKSYSLQPSMFEKSRWLLIRTWSEKVSSSASPLLLGMPDTKVKIIASRSLSIRPLPVVRNPSLHVLAPFQIDAFGTMAGSSVMPSITDAQIRDIDEADDEIISGGGAVVAGTMET